MKSEIKRFGILRAGKVCAILYGLSVVICLPFGIPMIVDSAAGATILLVAMLYPLMAFICGVVFAALYNLTAKIGGGLQIELARVEEGYGPTRPDDIQLQPHPPTPVPEERGPSDDRTYAPPGYYD